jgi:8-amino-7-oxononanoate synthase
MDTSMPIEVRKTIKSWYPSFMSFRNLECGFLTMIGEGLSIHSDISRHIILPFFLDEMNKISEKEGVDIQLIRDIPCDVYKEYLPILKNKGFLPLLGFSETVLSIIWSSIDDYLIDLNSKTRLKFKSCFKLEEKFGVTWSVLSDFRHLAPIFSELWSNVNNRAGEYSREILDELFFRTVSEQLEGHCEAIVFYHNDKVIAFMLNMFDEKEYIVLDWGIDYDFIHYKKSNLYRAATLFSLQQAIKKNVKNMTLGITNYTPKFTLGAKLKPLVYFVKHQQKDRYTNALVKMISESIKQPDTSSHSPFKKKSNSQTIDINNLIQRIRQDQDNKSNSDLFVKTEQESRADALRLANIYGFYPEFSTAQKSSITMNGKKNVVLLGTNGYLGAAINPRVVEAAKVAVSTYGTGCSGSPLLNGTLSLHYLLEEELAEFYNREAVMLCSTGYQTNLAALSSLCEERDVVLMDARGCD